MTLETHPQHGAAGAVLEPLSRLGTADDWLVWRGRYLSTQFMVEADRAQSLVRIQDGRVVAVLPGPHVMPRWSFALRASDDAWRRFWSARPQPGFHDLMAMIKFRTLRLEGDQHPFMANLLYFKDLLALPRSDA